MEKKKSYISSERTKKKIKDTFVRLYSDNGTDSFSVSALCKECNIARSSFYLYYESKYALLDEIKWDLIEETREINHRISAELVRNPDTHLIKEIALNNFRFIKSSQAKYKVLMSPDGFTDFASLWCSEIQGEITRQLLSHVTSKKPRSIAVTVFSRALIGIYTDYIFGRTDMNEKELADYMIALLNYLVTKA